MFLVAAFTVCWRLFSPADNFSPVIAVFLCLGALSSKSGRWRGELLTGFCILFATDLIIGLYSTMAWVYFGHFLAFILGRSIAGRSGPLLLKFAGGTLLGSSAFYLVSNSGVWLTTTMYPHDFAGYLNCLRAGLPFFLRSLTATALFLPLMMVLSYKPQLWWWRESEDTDGYQRLSPGNPLGHPAKTSPGGQTS